jgi:hypothetical protein
MYGFGIGSTLDGSIVQYLKISEYLLQIGGIVPVPSGLSNKKGALSESLARFILVFFLNWQH